MRKSNGGIRTIERKWQTRHTKRTSPYVENKQRPVLVIIIYVDKYSIVNQNKIYIYIRTYEMFVYFCTLLGVT